MKWIKTKARLNGRIVIVEVPAPKRRMQFSQKVCVFGMILVTAAWVGNFILLWNGREPMSDVTIAIINMFGAFTTGGYFALSGYRDGSLNKLKGKLGEEKGDDE